MACDFLYFFILTVTFACKGAVGAVAAAGALPRLLVADHADHRESDQAGHEQQDKDVHPVCIKPLEH